MATSNKMMGDMLRNRKADMAAMPGSEPYTGPEPANDADKATENTEKFQVLAPGDADTETQFEYEPFTDIPGAWVVYPPGVPCDPNEYRVRMDQPAGPDDFAEMQKALDDASDTGSEATEKPSADTSVVSELESDDR